MIAPAEDMPETNSTIRSSTTFDETVPSVDMTTAEICPPKAYMQGRSNDAACVTETFVSRALCQ